MKADDGRLLRHRLCKNVFHCTLAELEDRLTPEELYQWKVFDLIDPIGDVRFDTLFAQLCSFVALDSIDPPKWGSGLYKFLPKEQVVNDLLAKFDRVVKPNVTPDGKPIRAAKVIKGEAFGK